MKNRFLLLIITITLTLSACSGSDENVYEQKTKALADQIKVMETLIAEQGALITSSFDENSGNIEALENEFAATLEDIIETIDKHKDSMYEFSDNLKSDLAPTRDILLRSLLGINSDDTYFIDAIVDVEKSTVSSLNFLMPRRSYDYLILVGECIGGSDSYTTIIRPSAIGQLPDGYVHPDYNMEKFIFKSLGFPDIPCNDNTIFLFIATTREGEFIDISIRLDDISSKAYKGETSDEN